MTYSLHRGDDLGELTEKKLPQMYEPQAGMGDLTGELVSAYPQTMIHVNFP